MSRTHHILLAAAASKLSTIQHSPMTSLPRRTWSDADLDQLLIAAGMRKV